MHIPLKLYNMMRDAGDELCPNMYHVLRAFELTPAEQTRVVIIGQDPYHTRDKASGLAFGYSTNYKGPINSSLKNILTEVMRSVGQYETSPTLEHWARQGVLLLNTCLTTLLDKPLAHQDKGWEQFVINYLKELDQKVPNKVYLLWGNEAQNQIGPHLDARNNLILKAAHPCRHSAHRGFFGCDHFRLANIYLKVHGKQPINW